MYLKNRQLWDHAESLSGMGSWALDLGTGAVEWSRGMYLLFNRDPSQGPILPDDFMEGVFPEDRGKVRQEFEQAIASQVPCELDCRYRGEDGRVRWFTLRGLPFTNDEGARLVGGIAREITHQKAFEERLQSSERQYRLLFDVHPHPLWVYDIGTLRFLAVNNAAVAAYGYTREEFLGMTIKDIRPPSEIPKLTSTLAQLKPGYSGGKPWRHRTKDGRILHVEISSHDLVFDGRPAEIVFAYNVTQRQVMEQALRESEERFRELAENINDVFYIFDPASSRILYVSPAYETIWGLTCESLYEDGRTFLSVIHPDDRPLVEQSLGEQLTGQATQLDFRLIHRDGSVRWINDKSYPVVGADGEVQRIVGIARDMTDARWLEGQVLRAQRMEGIGTLAGGIAHDLNNVLAPIIMSIDLLKLMVREQPVLDILSTIHASAARGAEMVGQVLSFAKGVDGQRIDVSPVQLLREIQKICSDTFPKEITIRIRENAVPWPISGDPTQLHQVLLNLCVNARDAIPPTGGEIILSAGNFVIGQQDAVPDMGAAPGRYVRLEVEDTGSGMPREVLEKIFDPFFTTKDLGKGTGLGLSTTMAIVKSHKGFVHVESTPGEGTHFVICLPAASGTTTAEPPPPPATADLPRGNGETILLVDDDDAVRGIIHQTLVAFGYLVIPAADGAQAIALYADHREDIRVVITDLMMPVMDGPTTIRILRQLDPELPVIGASGMSASEKVGQAMAEGARHFVPKPYTAETLLKILRDVLHPEG